MSSLIVCVRSITRIEFRPLFRFLFPPFYTLRVQKKTPAANLPHFPARAPFIVEKIRAALYNIENSSSRPSACREGENTMKLGIEGDSPDPISQYYSINTDNSWFQRVFCTNFHYITSCNSILFHAKMVYEKLDCRRGEDSLLLPTKNRV